MFDVTQSKSFLDMYLNIRNSDKNNMKMRECHVDLSLERHFVSHPAGRGVPRRNAMKLHCICKRLRFRASRCIYIMYNIWCFSTIQNTKSYPVTSLRQLRRSKKKRWKCTESSATCNIAGDFDLVHQRSKMKL